MFGEMEPNGEGEWWQDPEEDDENADNHILLMLINYAHADEGNWEAQGRGSLAEVSTFAALLSGLVFVILNKNIWIKTEQQY